MQYAYIASSEALGEGELPAAPDRMGVVMGTSMSGISTIAETQEALTRLGQKQVGPRFIPKVLGNVAAANIAIQKGIQGPSLTISTACASGGDAISTAAMLLLMDEADAVVAVGAAPILVSRWWYTACPMHGRCPNGMKHLSLPVVPLTENGMDLSLGRAEVRLSLKQRNTPNIVVRLFWQS